MVTLAVLGLAGCQERGPESVAKEFMALLEGLSGRPDSARLERAFGMLSQDARLVLEQRAKAAAATLGRSVEPWELWRFDGFVHGDRVSDVELLAADDSAARVSLHYAWAFSPALGGPAQTPEEGELRLVHEEGAWRVRIAWDAHGDVAPAVAP